MRRIDRRRREQRLRALAIVGASFALGALTAVGLEWRLDSSSSPASPATLSRDAADGAALDAGREASPAEPGPPTEPRPTATTGAEEGAVAVELRERDFAFPVDDVDPATVHDSFSDARGQRRHEALDIMAPRGTPVRAVEDGRIARLFTSEAGGLTIYQFDPTESFCYYYAHLDRYAAGLREGDPVRRGQVIGYVGSTGNAAEDAPHLHFAISRLTPEKKWWNGEPINPPPLLR